MSDVSKRLRALALSALICACATPGNLPEVPPPDAIPALEGRLQLNPNDPVVLIQLGAARTGAGDADVALPLLERAVSIQPQRSAGHFFLALTLEELERPTEAIAAYRAYQDLVGGRSAEAVESRIRLLHRRELQVAARSALARENELAQVVPEEQNVAVFPFLFSASDPELAPLSRALAAMLTTDLSQSSRVTVLERLQVQTLLDEIQLGQGQLVDPSTAARSGYLLGARRIVQGQILGSPQSLGLEAAIIQSPEGGDGPRVSVTDDVERLFDMEKALVFEIFEEMGISLTAAERERVNQRPTESLQALLAYGTGLEAEDQGLFTEAAVQFQRAVSLDPGFAEAASAAEDAESMSDASTASQSDVIASVAVAQEIDIGAQVDEVLAAAVNRDPVQEALGAEGLQDFEPVDVGPKPTNIILIIERPGGAP